MGSTRATHRRWILEAVKKGLGIGFLPDFVCDSAIQQGDIVEILANYERPNLALYAIYPNRKHVPPRVTHCVAFIEQWFASK
ncbi:LysR substrate-binding domain-containing protein [Salinibius halmophilus]|uniref:LysR substrate-binding domain-containing protein n=1 Tax=Salinibius halmophilus TaxID=1853216 RepID=UPI000E664BFF|nr:LysR substrate-binding domain-containing protein [Salinibius halmophilus]